MSPYRTVAPTQGLRFTLAIPQGMERIWVVVAVSIGVVVTGAILGLMSWVVAAAFAVTAALAVVVSPAMVHRDYLEAHIDPAAGYFAVVRRNRESIENLFGGALEPGFRLAVLAQSGGDRIVLVRHQDDGQWQILCTLLVFWNQWTLYPALPRFLADVNGALKRAERRHLDPNRVTTRELLGS